MTDVNDQFTQSDLDVWRESLHDLISQGIAANIPPYEMYEMLQVTSTTFMAGFMKAMFDTLPE